MGRVLRTGLGDSGPSPAAGVRGGRLLKEPPSKTVWALDSGARVPVAVGSSRGGSSPGSPVRKPVHSSAVLAAEKKVFALVRCLALKTFLNNAKASVKK